MDTEYVLSYTGSEIEEKLGKIDNLATKSEVPTKISQLNNDSGFITGYTETDPTVPTWAKAATKPTYTASEVGALPDTTVIPTVPTNISAFANDTGYLTEHQSLEGLATEDYVNAQIEAIPTPDVSGQINTHNTSTSAHADIREQIGQLYSEVASKEQLTPEFANSIEECDDITKLYVLPDGYIYAYMYKTGYSYTNIMPVGSGQTKNGLTTTVNEDGSYTLDGTATATAVHKIYESNTALPAGFVVGSKYKMALEAGYVGTVAIMINYGSGFEDFISFNSGENSNKFVEFTIPDSAVGMQIKYYPAVNYQYANEVVKFSCYEWQEGGEGFNNTGLPFVPADYEDRIQALEKAVESLDGSADVSPKPMLTIIDDDGYKKFTTLLLPIVQEKGVSIASAVVVGNANGENSEDVTSVVMDWTEVETAYLAGAEILSHTYCHLSQAKAETMTKTQIQQDYQRAQYGMRKHGIDADGLVFAGNSVSMDICQEACKLVYTHGFKSYGDVINFKGSIDPYKINRYKIKPDGLLNETDLKALIDTLVSGGTGWMIWMIHTSDGGFQQAQADIISTVIDYAIGQGVEIVTTECGVRHYL